MNLSIHTLKLLVVAGVVLVKAMSSGQAQAATETAVLAGGCFWCVEADFAGVPGVIDVVSGFTGGKLADPTYEDVSGGDTGHYEAVQIRFDPAKVSYATLVSLLLHSTDVVDAGGQFCDRGDSYRTAIFAATAGQQTAAEAEIARASAELGQKVVTRVLAAKRFYPADAYHQDYSLSSEIILTRRGPKSKANAYKFYRGACGRDARVKQLWGSSAQFLH